MDLISEIVMENNMKKIFLLIFILLNVAVFSQTSMPKSWTKNLGLRLYNSGAIPSADSLNQNMVDIDDSVGAFVDSLEGLTTRFYTSHNFNGTIKQQILDWDMLTLTARGKIVTTDNTGQNISGVKAFLGGIMFGSNGIFHLTSYGTSVQGMMYRSGVSGADELMFNYSGSSKDTMVSRRWFRNNLPTLANAVDLTNNQSIAGIKTISTGVQFGAGSYLSLPLPTTGGTTRAPRKLFADEKGIYYNGTGGDVVVTNPIQLANKQWVLDTMATLPVSIIPKTNNTYDLGSPTRTMKDIYSQTVTTGVLWAVEINPVQPTPDITVNGRLLFSDTTYAIGQRGDGGGIGAVYADSLISNTHLQIVGLGQGVNIQGQQLSFDGMVLLGGGDTVTIVSNDITVTKSYKIFDESAPTTVKNIYVSGGLKDGMTLTLVNVGGETVTIDGTAGNIDLSSDAVMTRKSTIMLLYSSAFSKWIELSRNIR